jgi:hypothetical protein
VSPDRLVLPPLVSADVEYHRAAAVVAAATDPNAPVRRVIFALIAGVQQLREDVEEVRRADRRRTVARARRLVRLAAQRATPGAAEGQNRV